ncbi:hypothetical protein [Rubrimonas cliftonensis]|nr:hypothetical protein [Rubrimonas cliftonensis]
MLAALLCLFSAVMITASLFIADRASRSPEILWISLAVSGVFLAAGLLAVGVQGRMAAIDAIIRHADPARRSDLARHHRAPILFLAGGGAVLCLALAVIVSGDFARIEEGFAVYVRSPPQRQGPTTRPAMAPPPPRFLRSPSSSRG